MFKNLFKKSQTQSEVLIAPLNGKIVPLEEVPDPVFSQKMMGEGAAIIPSEGKVVAPISGKIVQVPESKHAIGLESDNGTEILIHVGLETVALKGEGFEVKVSTGDTVTVGQSLIEFDLEYIRKEAKDIVTPIIITNSKPEEKDYHVTSDVTAIAGETELITITNK
ncbi:PTS glucose transporter subunit IIA [Virgibacillus soli]|uniref:PTS glucose transporter subunit IIA n=1 Tax=Paracerasibacillus soli TaxID=480284 RepID=A0ABU5CNX0_9BACI|nr:PTS glucose transporter subunit IIA [Virgibacillus soli]MDY0407504.1 PTS glucose transporter subunit IIA [Virgibacillus soli]